MIENNAPGCNSREEIEAAGRCSVGVETDSPVRVSQLYLNSPEPFGRSTTITYQLSRPSKVSVTLYDQLGRMVRRLETGQKLSGVHYKVLDLSELAPGVYFYQLRAERSTETRRLTIVR